MAKHVNKEQKRMHFFATFGMSLGRAIGTRIAHPEWTDEQIVAELLKHEQEDDLAMWDYTAKKIKEAKAE